MSEECASAGQRDNPLAQSPEGIRKTRVNAFLHQRLGAINPAQRDSHFPPPGSEDCEACQFMTRQEKSILEAARSLVRQKESYNPGPPAPGLFRCDRPGDSIGHRVIQFKKRRLPGHGSQARMAARLIRPSVVILREGRSNAICHSRGRRLGRSAKGILKYGGPAYRGTLQSNL